MPQTSADQTQNILTLAALIAATLIGLASLYWAVQHGRASLKQGEQAGTTIGEGFAQMIRLLQDVQASQRDLEEQTRRDAEVTRMHVSREAELTRSHSTTGHLETRQVIRDRPR